MTDKKAKQDSTSQTSKTYHATEDELRALDEAD
jgi:hypothetical protein